MVIVPITCTASDQNGNPVAGARITAKLNQTEIYQGVIVPESITVIANASGIAILSLWPNALGTQGSMYRVTATNPDTGIKYLDVTVSVPNSACNLHEIIVVEPYPELSDSAAALIAVQALVAAADVDAATATAAAAVAQSYLTAYRATSYGALASDPTLDPNGGAPTAGDEYFNTTSNLLKRFNGVAWQVPDINTTNLAAPSGASLVGYMPAGTGAVATTVDAVSKRKVSVYDFMTPTQIAAAKAHDTALSTSSAILAALTSGAKDIDFEDGWFNFSFTEQTAFATFTGVDGITLHSSKGARLVDTGTYTVSPANPFSPVFLFDGCSNYTVTGIEYVGPAIATPETNHGYVGATFVRARAGSVRGTVKAKLTNCRYGVESGTFPAATSAADGYCYGIDIDLTTSFVAYPIAAYLASNITGKINSANVHRSVYLAGCENVQLDVINKNQYIANAVALVTDAYTGLTTTRGCKNVKINVTDNASDRTELTCVLVAIIPQVPAYASTFTDIDIKVNAVCTNAIGQHISAFQMLSSGWKTTDKLINISVTGLIDKSAQTSSQSTGILYVQANTGAVYPAVSNFSLKDLTIRPSSGAATVDYLYLQGLLDAAHINDCAMDNYYLEMIGSAANPFIVANSTLGNIQCQTPIFYINSTVKSATDASWASAKTLNSTFGGAGAGIRVKQVTLALTGATTSWASAIPAGAIVLGVVGRVMTDITGTTGYWVGTGADYARFVSSNTLTAGSTFSPVAQSAANISPLYSGTGGGGAVAIVVTAKTATFTGGSIKLMLSYIDMTAPTA
jgi:hypothetical protein